MSLRDTPKALELWWFGHRLSLRRPRISLYKLRLRTVVLPTFTDLSLADSKRLLGFV